jgi:hypothetical protein
MEQRVCGISPKPQQKSRVKIPNHEAIATPIQYDWSSSIYGNVKEELPPDMPTPRGKLVRTSTYQDAMFSRLRSLSK